MGLRRRAGLLWMMVAAAPLVVGGCTGAPAGEQAQVAASPAPAPPELAVTPASREADVPVSAEIGTAVSGGRVTAVTLTDDRGARVIGSLREDGTSWVPLRPLAYRRAYTANVIATAESGATVTRSTTFTTMAAPTRLVDTTLYFTEGRTYGTAMPITLDFGLPVPEDLRDDVQRRLFVTTDPPQPGAWHWLDSGREVFYRAPDFWQPGTRISVRTALQGVPMGGGWYGDENRAATSKIGNSVAIAIDNANKKMKVTIDGKLARTIPVSMGKPSTPTSSGKMVIMEKFDYTTFDTRNDPAGGYVVTVSNAQRLTWGGEFIHAAPWSVGDQGRRNVSHGCTNVSDSASSWLMDVTHVGDLVTIKGTEVDLEMGNGWTAWNLSWDDFVKGSALPVPADLVPAAQRAASLDRSPSAAPAPAPEPEPSGR